MFVIVALWVTGALGIPSPFGPLPYIPSDPRILLGVAIPILLVVVLRIFKVDDSSRLNRYLHSLSYAITNQRLLILEGDEIYSSYTPEQAREPIIRERSAMYSDLIFDEFPIRRGDGSVVRDPVYRERRQVAFKALPNAQEMQQRVAEWLSDYQDEAARDVADFVEAAPSRQRSDRPQNALRIENKALGLKLDVPEEWKARVRMKKKPQGKIFIDKEEWHELGQTDAWNLVTIEGPSHCNVEVEVFETEPTISFDKLAHSKLAAMGGQVIDSSSDFEINGLRGFYVTRRANPQAGPETQKAGTAAVVAPIRQMVLRDGQRQICIASTWPEDSEDLKRAVDAVVESISVT